MSQAQECVEIISQHVKDFKPKIGLILGSGLGQFCDNIDIKNSLNFTALPGFPVAGVGGHAGKLLFGEVQGTNVVVMQGRAHYYEHGKADIMAVAIEVLNAIGCKSLVLTNAAGSTLEESTPGSVMLITDHINMTGISPLFGADGNERFVNMVNAYDPKLSNDMREAAKANNITLHEGVYAWFSGPQFETPAEIRAVTILGADAVLSDCPSKYKNFSYGVNEFRTVSTFLNKVVLCEIIVGFSLSIDILPKLDDSDLDISE